MKDSTKRGIRTLVQGILAAGVAVSVAIPLVPHATEGRIAAALAGAVAVAAVVAKIWAALEEAGVVPEWLRSDEEHFEAGFDEGRKEAAKLARSANDVTMLRRPLEGFRSDRPPAVDVDTGEQRRLAAELGSRAEQLDDNRPGRHSVDRAGGTPTSQLGRPTGPYSAAAPVVRGLYPTSPEAGQPTGRAPEGYEMNRRPWLGP